MNMSLLCTVSSSSAVGLQVHALVLEARLGLSSSAVKHRRASAASEAAMTKETELQGTLDQLGKKLVGLKSSPTLQNIDRAREVLPQRPS